MFDNDCPIKTKIIPSHVWKISLNSSLRPRNREPTLEIRTRTREWRAKYTKPPLTTRCLSNPGLKHTKSSNIQYLRSQIYYSRN